MPAHNYDLKLDKIQQIEAILLRPLNFEKVVQEVVDEVIRDLEGRKLGYRIVVLTLVDKKSKLLKRYSVTQTAEAKKALNVMGKNFGVSFRSIDIPLSFRENASIQAINTKAPIETHDFRQILVPGVTPSQALAAQEESGIKSSFVFPLIVRNSVIGTIIFSTSKERKLSKKESNLLSYYTGIVGLAVQNSMLYSKLASKSSELAKANKELIKIDSQKDEFISIVSHELKTPISIVKTNLWMLSHVGSDSLDTKQKQLISEMKSGLDRLGRMVNNILDVSRIQQGRLIIEIKEQPLQPILDTVVSEFSETLKQKKLKIIQCKDFKSGFVDKEKFMEVLANLISNAIKYTNEGGIKISCKQQGDFVKISVVDSGVGISKEEQKNLFKKFSRAQAGLKEDSPGASTGLGLFIVKRMVEEMGGDCGVESTLNKGSRFWFTIPTVSKVKVETTEMQSKLKKWQEQNKL